MAEDTTTPVVRLVPGVVQAEPGATGSYPLAVNVGGTFPPVWWPAGYIPTLGDAVKVLLVDGIAVVHSPVTATQRPLTGTVQGTASNGQVPVTTAAGVLQCRFVGTAPAVGTLVRLDWQATTPWVWPSVAAPVVPPGTGPPSGGGPTPPPTATTGALSVVALDSATWNARYSNWTGQNGLDLTQGTWSGTAYTGAWWYGSAPTQLAGRTITRFQIRLGGRRRIGNYNAALGLQLFITSDLSRPAGDTTRIVGPHVITLAPGQGPGWVDLPTSWGLHLATNGGGLAIAGGDYGGVVGIGGDPASGQLFFDWRA